MNKKSFSSLICSVAAVLLISTGAMRFSAHAQGNTPNDYVAPAVFQAAGPSGASIFETVQQFRLAVGDPNNGSNASQPSGRREINWDGGGSATSPGGTPFTVFLNTRGALLTTPGSGFVQAPPSGLETTFGNTTYDTAFLPFSLQRLFAVVGSNIAELRFFIPGTAGSTPAVTKGFGVVLSDVDQPDGSGPGGKRGNRGASTLVEYFSQAGQLLYSSFAPASPGEATFSFVGIVFNDARIAAVRITTGDAAPGPDDAPNRDIVVMDDFIYGEPRISQ